MEVERHDITYTKDQAWFIGNLRTFIQRIPKDGLVGIMDEKGQRTTRTMRVITHSARSGFATAIMSRFARGMYISKKYHPGHAALADRYGWLYWHVTSTDPIPSDMLGPPNILVFDVGEDYRPTDLWNMPERSQRKTFEFIQTLPFCMPIIVKSRFPGMRDGYTRLQETLPRDLPAESFFWRSYHENVTTATSPPLANEANDT